MPNGYVCVYIYIAFRTYSRKWWRLAHGNGDESALTVVVVVNDGSNGSRIITSGRHSLTHRNQ